ncbi:nuclear transport factor 2 family protein [Solihabitans fulvus]|uniref:Nuclear transport factor 2 family protein n=1 Tax=Solihabitans fulvus TaxID=1892852 RepID=A0A5B2WEW1_9PSEU|nr:nuclear transport factor 2 family protein [Solihabitans fulvus]
MPNESVSDLADRVAIVETCTRMAWHTDQREWDRLAEVFADIVTLDYTSLNGGEPADLTPAQIVGAWSGLLGALDATQHLITNHLVAVTGDVAVCTASFQATHRLANPFGSPLWTLGGTYRFDLVRAGAAWLIRGVVMTATWADGNKDLLAIASAKLEENAT